MTKYIASVSFGKDSLAMFPPAVGLPQREQLFPCTRDWECKYVPYNVPP